MKQLTKTAGVPSTTQTAIDNIAKYSTGLANINVPKIDTPSIGNTTTLRHHIKVPDFTHAISGVATVGNTAAYMVAFLLPGTRRLIIARYLSPKHL